MSAKSASATGRSSTPENRLCWLPGVVMDHWRWAVPPEVSGVGLFPSDAVGIDQFLASFELLEPDGLCPVGS